MPIDFCLLFFGQPGPGSAQLGILAVPSGFAARGGSGSSLGGEVRERSRHRGLRSLAPAPRPRRTSRASLRPRSAPAAPRHHAGAAGRRDGAAGQRRRGPRGLRARGGECGAARRGGGCGVGQDRVGVGARGYTPPSRVLKVMPTAAAGRLRIATAEELPGSLSLVLNLAKCKTRDFSCISLEMPSPGHWASPVLLGLAGSCFQPWTTEHSLSLERGHGSR